MEHASVGHEMKKGQTFPVRQVVHTQHLQHRFQANIMDKLRSHSAWKEAPARELHKHRCHHLQQMEPIQPCKKSAPPKVADTTVDTLNTSPTSG